MSRWNYSRGSSELGCFGALAIIAVSVAIGIWGLKTAWNLLAPGWIGMQTVDFWGAATIMVISLIGAAIAGLIRLVLQALYKAMLE